jgi:multidrug efflux pump subunit AcrB
VIDFLERRVRLIGLVVGMFFLLGLLSLLTMSRQEDPGFPQRAGLITVHFPGATAEIIGRLVLTPLSDELRQVEEVAFFDATARIGVAVIRVELRDRIYQTDAAWDRVRQAMDRARREFPSGVVSVQLDDRQIDMPAVVLALSGDSSLAHLTHAAKRLERALLDLPGLSRIELLGGVEEEIVIAVRDTELQRFGWSHDQFVQILSARNRIVPGGFIVAGDTRLGLLPETEFADLEALRRTPIPLPSGGSLPLSAIADVWRGPREPPEPRAWFDGEPSVLVTLILEGDQVDVIRFGTVLRERVRELQPDFVPLTINEMFFQPDQVQWRLQDLGKSLLLAWLIVNLVIFLVMGWRMGLIVSSMLPLVVMISLGLFNLGGGILHQISVIAIVIALGILVDNVIVMVEQVQDHLDRGHDRLTAMRTALRQLAAPLGAATGTTLAAFVPLLLSKGAVADFTRGIPVVIMLTLTVSYLLAISIAALMAARFLRPRRQALTAGQPDGATGLTETQGTPLGTYPSASPDSSLFTPPDSSPSGPSVKPPDLSRHASPAKSFAVSIATVLGRWSTNYPITVITLSLALVLASLALIPWMKLQFFPDADRPVVVVEVFLPVGGDLLATQKAAERLEDAVRNRPEVRSVHRFVGSTGPVFYYNLPRANEAPNRARLVVNLENLAATDAFLYWVRDYVLLHQPEITIIATRLGQGPPRLAPIEIRLYHPDENQRVVAAERMYSWLHEIPGTVDVRHDIDFGLPVLHVTVDDAKAALLGLNRIDTARALFGSTLGRPVEIYRQELDPMAIVLRDPEGIHQSTTRLLSTLVFNAQGEAIPLTAFARIEPRWLPAGIEQRNGQTLNTVTANLESGVGYNQVLSELRARLVAMPLPAGTRIEWGGDAEGSGDANRNIAVMAPIGLLLLLFFLLLQFNSFRRTGIVLVTVPLAAVGVIPGLVLSGQPFGFQSLLGVIALVGIVLNNAIVLIDRIDERLRVGDRIGEAVMDAVQRRLRPILLTTATTVAGMLPLAFSSSTLWPPMAWAIISGLLASTVLTLLVIPALCYRLLR